MDWSGIIQIFKDAFTWALNFIFDLFSELNILGGWVAFFVIGLVFSTIILPFLRPNSFTGFSGVSSSEKIRVVSQNETKKSSHYRRDPFDGAYRG